MEVRGLSTSLAAPACSKAPRRPRTRSRTAAAAAAGAASCDTAVPPAVGRCPMHSLGLGGPQSRTAASKVSTVFNVVMSARVLLLLSTFFCSLTSCLSFPECVQPGACPPSRSVFGPRSSICARVARSAQPPTCCQHLVVLQFVSRTCDAHTGQRYISRERLIWGRPRGAAEHQWPHAPQTTVFINLIINLSRSVLRRH